MGLRKADEKPRQKLKTLKEKQGQILKNKIKNKTFYFKPVKTSTSVYGGRNFKADIFMNTRSGLKQVSTAKWNTASYRGDDSEVLNQLVRDNVLPKETLSLSKSSYSGSGYYGWELKDLTGLKIKESQEEKWINTKKKKMRIIKRSKLI